MSDNIVGIYATKAMPLPQGFVVVQFTNNEVKIYPALHIFSKFPEDSLAGEIVADKDLYMSVFINDMGTLEWENGLDLDVDVVYKKSIPLNENVLVKDMKDRGLLEMA